MTRAKPAERGGPLPERRNHCARCAKVCIVEFAVPPAAWDAIAGRWQHEYLCIDCFDELAGDARWDSDIELVAVSRVTAATEAGNEAARRLVEPKSSATGSDPATSTATIPSTLPDVAARVWLQSPEAEKALVTAIADVLRMRDVAWPTRTARAVLVTLRAANGGGE